VGRSRPLDDELPREAIMWELFWLWQQQNDINDARSQAQRSGDRAAAAEQRVRDLERRVEHLALACMSMWSLLRDRSGLSDEQLRAQMQKIDEADGVADGRAGPTLIQCPACGRNVFARRGRCMYCGAACGGAEAF
jgi:hypothetical protein